MNAKLSAHNFSFSNDNFSNRQSVIDNAFNFNNNESDQRFNFKKINFFNSQLHEKSSFIDASMKHTSDDIVFRDIYLFIARVKNFVDVHEIELIRKNLFRCLQDDIID